MSKNDVAIELSNIIESSDELRAFFNPRASQLYESLPVEPSSAYIRLLDLDGHDGNPEEPLSGTLRRVDIKNGPKFSALSYVWGTWSNPPDSIRCNDCAVPITINCYEALRSLRNKLGAITIWVDNICINQQNVAEKAEQIQLMGSIYTYAQPTYIWLGPGSEATDRAMNCIRLSSRLRAPPLGIPWLSKDWKESPGEDRRRLVLELLKIWKHNLFLVSRPIKRLVQDQFHADDFDELLRTEWLSRVWTFQEVILASDPVIVRGTSHLGWWAIYQWLDCRKDILKSYPYWLLPYCHYGLPSSTLSPWRDLTMVWAATPRPIRQDLSVRKTLQAGDIQSARAYLHKHIRPCLNVVRSLFYPLGTLIFLAGGATICFAFAFAFAFALDHKIGYILLSGCALCIVLLLIPLACAVLDDFLIDHEVLKPHVSDADVAIIKIVQTIRDRSATEPKDKSFALHGVLRRSGIRPLKPDYRRTLGDVYCEMVIKLLVKNSHAICLLVDAGISKLDAPSWVPDWSTSNNRAWMSTSYLHGPSRGWHRHQRPYFTIRSGILETEGVWRGSVTLVLHAFTDLKSVHETGDPEEILKQFCSFVQDVSKFVQMIQYRNPGLSRTTISHSLKNAFLADQINWAQRDIGEQDELYSSYEDFFRLVHAFPQILNQGEGLQHVENEVCKVFSGRLQMQTFLLRCCKRIGGKRGIFFAQPNIIASGPPNVLEGDHIANIDGVSVPLVLRETSVRSGRYKVVGPAFADNLMWWGENGVVDFGQLELHAWNVYYCTPLTGFWGGRTKPLGYRPENAAD